MSIRPETLEDESSGSLSAGDEVRSRPAPHERNPIVRNVLSGWTVMIASLAYGLVITPLVVKTLHAELYGVWSFLNSLIAYSDLLYLGLGSALVRNVARYRVTGDTGSMNRLLSVVVGIYVLLGTVCLIAMIGVSTVAPRFFAEGLSEHARWGAQYTCWFLGLRLFLLFSASGFSGLVAGHERYDLLNGVSLCGTVLRFLTIPAAMKFADPLLGLAATTTAVALGEALAIGSIAFIVRPNLRMRLAWPHFDELKLLYGFGLQSFFIVLAVKLISYTDTTVIGVMLGASSVTLYTLPLQLVEYSRGPIGGVTGVFLPRLTVLVTQNDTAALRDAFLRATRFAGFLSGWSTATVMTLGVPFLALWVGREFTADAQWLLVFLGLASFCQTFSIHIPFGFYQALHALRFPAMILVCEGLLNLVLSMWLASRMGLVGVALSTLVPALFVSAAVLPPYLCRRLSVSLTEYLRSGLVPGITALIGTLGFQLALNWFLPVTGYPMLAMRALLTIVPAAVMFKVTFPPEDSQRVIDEMRQARTVVQRLAGSLG